MACPLLLRADPLGAVAYGFPGNFALDGANHEFLLGASALVALALDRTAATERAREAQQTSEYMTLGAPPHLRRRTENARLIAWAECSRRAHPCGRPDPSGSDDSAMGALEAQTRVTRDAGRAEAAAAQAASLAATAYDPDRPPVPPGPTPATA